MGSLLILLYFFSKLVPKKNMIGIGILLGGYSFAGYIVHWIVFQGIDFVQENWVYLSVYIAIAGVISFAALYRFGPAHPRSLQLVQWLLQFIALACIYFSFFQIPVVAFVAVLAFLLWYIMPPFISRRLNAM